jgi:hypothetical protein
VFPAYTAARRFQVSLFLLLYLDSMQAAQHLIMQGVPA